MRAPTDLPRRRPRPPRLRLGLAVAAAVVVVLLLSLRGIAGFYTDFLWFDGLGLARVWRGILGAKVALALIFTAVFFVLLWLNLTIADRLAPAFRPAGPEEEIVERYRDFIGSRAWLVRVVLAGLFALIVGLPASSQWNSWVLYTHKVAFGTKDPLFHKDVGYYVFTLPFLKFLVDWAFGAIAITLVITAVAHYLNGGIRIQVPAIQRVTPQVKAHLSVLLGGLALLKAVGYWLQRYELTYSTRGVVDGANYTDVHAQLPALYLLVAISIFAAGLFIFNIWRRGWAFPIIAVGLWAFTSVIVGGAYPAFVQKFRVEPNQSTKERTYIQRNIDATRQALAIDDKHVKVDDFGYKENLTPADLDDNRATIQNVRLWDPSVLQRTYAQQQEIRKFYTFNDVDVDRYQVNGQETQVMLSARELATAGLPSSTWENTHLNFTHGYGAVVSAANAVTSDGLPAYLLSDLPPTGTPKLQQPAIYYGENLGGYAIVRTKRKEIDYQTDNGTVRTTYQGDGGVPVSSLVRRVAFALRFGDVNPLISSFITKDSRAIYIRDIGDRVRKVAPFLKFDADPYPVLLDGRIFWLQDAYTTTSRYPYAQRATSSRLDPSSGLNARFNYVRNSVKILINAYDGSMQFYVTDPTDPIIRAYQKAFPQLFTPGRAMSSDLRSHLRYPEDLFRVQTDAFAQYHITDAPDFYDQGDAWDIARDPGSGQEVTAPQTPVTSLVGNRATVVSTAADDRMAPYYLLMRLPQEARESFLILQPFTPKSKDLLSAFMVAKSDPADYGKLEVFEMPRSLAVSGPTQVDAKINQEPSISKEISLLNSSGSKLINGNLLVIPVNNSLLYIRPLYVQAEGTQLPELKRVVVVYGQQVVSEPTLRQSLADIFGAAPATQEQAATGGGTPPPSGGTGGPALSATVQSLLDQALAAFQAADAALKSGDLAAYQRDIQQGEALAQQARDAAARGSSSSSGRSTTTTTAPTSA
jgi:uncharacterized protein